MMQNFQILSNLDDILLPKDSNFKKIFYILYYYYIDITIFLRHYLRNRENFEIYFESASNYINANILFKVYV